MRAWQDAFFEAADEAILAIQVAKLHYQNGSPSYVVNADLADVRRKLREAQAVLHGRR